MVYRVVRTTNSTFLRARMKLSAVKSRMGSTAMRSLFLTASLSLSSFLNNFLVSESLSSRSVLRIAKFDLCPFSKIYQFAKEHLRLLLTWMASGNPIIKASSGSIVPPSTFFVYVLQGFLVALFTITGVHKSR